MVKHFYPLLIRRKIGHTCEWIDSVMKYPNKLLHIHIMNTTIRIRRGVVATTYRDALQVYEQRTKSCYSTRHLNSLQISWKGKHVQKSTKFQLSSKNWGRIKFLQITDHKACSIEIETTKEKKKTNYILHVSPRFSWKFIVFFVYSNWLHISTTQNLPLS